MREKMIDKFQNSILHKISVKIGRNGKFEEFEKFEDEIKLFVFVLYPAFIFLLLHLFMKIKLNF